MPTTRRLPGIHDHAGRRADVLRSVCAGRRSFPHAEERAEEGRPQHQCRRRRRLRAQPADRPKRRSISSWRRSRRPATSPASDSCWRSIAPPSEFFKDGKYRLRRRRQERVRSEEQVEYLAELVATYPIVSIEDGMAEDDWEGWKLLTDADRRASASSSATICSSPT